MSIIGLLILPVVVGLPVAWFVAEFKGRAGVRRILGVLAILSAYGVSFILGQLISRLDYNAWYGAASKSLIDASVARLEHGDAKAVLTEWKKLQDRFNPTYENRAHYDELVKAAVRGLEESRDHAESSPSNATIVQLRRALYSYLTGPRGEPVDTPESRDHILALLKNIEPLDCVEKINVALDIFVYYDASDNGAGIYARQMLVKCGNSALPYVRDRARSAINPEEIKNLIRDITGLPSASAEPLPEEGNS